MSDSHKKYEVELFLSPALTLQPVTPKPEKSARPVDSAPRDEERPARKVELIEEIIARIKKL